MTRWEYTYAEYTGHPHGVKREFLKLLNEYGQQGWELVAQEYFQLTVDVGQQVGTMRRPLAE
jgi:hypothetical protein